MMAITTARATVISAGDMAFHSQDGQRNKEKDNRNSGDQRR
jgi:hypothetical protein